MWEGLASDEVDVDQPLTIAELEHWVAFGATWRVVQISDRRAFVDMCQCTGELVEQRHSTDPIVLDYLRSHPDPGAPE
jgi:hypothetical protein